MKISSHRVVAVALIGTLLAASPWAMATEEDCYFQRNNHFDVGFRAVVSGPVGEAVTGPGYNASVIDESVCWTGVSHETLDTRIIPRGSGAVRVAYSPYWPGGPADHGLPTMCYAGDSLTLELDGLGWSSYTVDMTCTERSYRLDWTEIPDAPVTSGTLRLTVLDHHGRPDSATYYVL